MQRYFADEIRQRVAAEKARTHYPSGFPALPPVAAARYCDPGFLQLERDHVFGKSWLFVAHVDVLEQKATTIWLLEQGHSRMFIGQYRRFERNPLLPRFPKVNPVTGEGQERRIYHLHEAIDRSIGAELIPARLRVPAILGEFVEQ